MIYCAAAAFTVSGAPVLAADQATSQPAAATKMAPQPTLEEELVYMRDVIALQTLRLDEAEQSLSRQSDLINTQAQQIAELQNLVRASQQVLASMGASSGATFNGGYRVVSGDTLSQIARRNNTTVRALAQANNLRSPYRLRIGQRLNVPGAAPATPTRVAQADPIAAQISKVEQTPASDNAQQQPQRVASAQSVTPDNRPDVTKRVTDQQPDRKPDDRPSGNVPEAVGVRPDEQDELPELASFADVGGVLTPRGTLYVEPGIDFATSSDNRFFFQGVEIASAVLIGAIEATDTDRQAITESFGIRYGLTNRLEIDGSISYVSRQDRVSGISIDNNTAATRNLGGYGIGDANFGLHYQLTNGGPFPYTILNLRAKAPTGDGPFDVARDADGFDTELATGSGFWSVEPSLSFILPTSPAVIFANVGYQKNLSVRPNSFIGPNTIIEEFDPGDAIRTSLGVGISLNERLSLNFGYDQSNFFKSTSRIRQENIFRPRDEDGEPGQDILEDSLGNLIDENGDIFTFNPDGSTSTGALPRLLFNGPFTEIRMTESPSTTVGSFLFGGSYAVTDSFRINLNTAFGATDEAPDMRVSLRAQYKLFGKK